MIEILKEIALIIGYIGTIVSFAFGAFKVYKKIDQKLSTIECHTKENYTDIKRLTFVSKEMPIGERLDAGEKYVRSGGNGEVKAQYKVLKKEYEEQLTSLMHLGGDSHV